MSVLDKSEWFRLYQLEGTTIEELISICLKSYARRYNNARPEKILISWKVKSGIREFEGISVSQDTSLYSPGMIALSTPK